ncbi:MAG: penicillin acylase family protein [Myxococcota bacterium]
MSVGEGPQADGGGAGLSGLAVRLVAVALTILALIVGTQQWGAREREQRERFAPSSGTVRLADLEAPVEILRDGRGVPHVIAAEEAEGWFALGFAHAQDRLAQMEFLRRRAAGRSGEIEGQAALRWDRLARLLEIQRTAVRTVEALPEDSRVVLEAYASGVNARIRRIRQGRVPPPHGLAGAFGEVGDWRPADSVAIVKLLSWCIGGTLETTLVLDDLIQRLDSVPARPFFPGRASVDFGVAPEVPRHSVPSLTVDGPLAEAVMGTTRGLCEGVGIPTGGAWVLSGARTESRKPAIVADWHFEPTVPGLLYQAHVAAGGLDLAGATLPGSPIFWVGRTPDFAWAAVPASAPVSDLFIETLRERRGLYQNGTLWVPIEEREEVLRYRDVRGDLVEETLYVRSTRHGPLIDSLWRDGEARLPVADAPAVNRAARALAWTGARDGDGLTSMLALARATGASEVPAILESHHEPVLAFAYADARGEGGVQVAGWLPSRPLPTGLVPVQGRLRSFDWREPVAVDALPGQEIGERGRSWALALDQPWPGRGGLDQTEWLWRPGDRATRLELALDERLAAGRLDLRGAADLLADAEAPRATRVVTAIVGLARLGGALAIEAEEIAGLLERWDGRLDSDSAGAAAYHLVIEHLLERLLSAPLGEGLFARYLAAPHVRPQSAVERLVLRAAKLRQPGGWTDEADVTAAVRAGLRDAWVSLNHRLGPTRERWAWGELHRMPLRRLGEFDDVLRRLSVAGSGQTLAFTRHRPGVSFDVERAALYRVAIDLGARDRFLSSLAPGQSEHLGHPHEADGLSRWRRNDLALFATSRLVIEEENAERLVLEPAP